MYHHATFCPLSRLRFFVVWAMLLLGTAKEGYGQRVYANVQSIATGALGGTVSNASRAVDNNYDNFSTLNVGIGLLNLMYTTQNLRFSETTWPKPENTSPIIIKFSSVASIANLIGGISIQRTNNGINNTVGTEYTSSELLMLLNGSTDSEVIIPIPGGNSPSDGVRLRISTVLGAGLSANLYYAFYITPPQLTNNEVFRCEEESGAVIIDNFQNGYTYRLYTAEIGGTQIPEAATTTATLTFPSNLEGTYWLEARENDIYPSARTEINITVVPQPGHPELTITDMPD